MPSPLFYHIRFEKLLRMYDPTISLCYWDSSLEPTLPASSPTWTSRLFGTPSGVVQSGFAGGWMTPLGPLTRNVGQVGRPYIAQVPRGSVCGALDLPRLYLVSFRHKRLCVALDGI